MELTFFQLLQLVDITINRLESVFQFLAQCNVCRDRCQSFGERQTDEGLCGHADGPLFGVHFFRCGSHDGFPRDVTAIFFTGGGN